MKKFLEVCDPELGFLSARIDVTAFTEQQIEAEAERLQKKYAGRLVEERKTKAEYVCFER